MKNSLMKIDLIYEQVIALVMANLKIRYRRTIAGIIWVLLNPTILLIVQTVVFSSVLKISIKTYLPYLFSGFLPWVFISQTIDMGTTQHKYFSASIRAFNIHPLVVTAALTIENLTTLLMMLFIYSAVSFLFFDINFFILIAWVLSCLPLILAVFSLTFSVAILYSKFRDIKFITSFALSVLFFLSPIFYSIDLVSPDQRIYFKLNPFYHLLSPFQSATTGTSLIDWSVNYAVSFLVAFSFLLVSACIWKINKRDIHLYL